MNCKAAEAGTVLLNNERHSEGGAKWLNCCDEPSSSLPRRELLRGKDPEDLQFENEP